MQPRTISEAIYQANAARRARNLRAEGYTISADPVLDDIYTVRKPDGTFYTVNTYRRSCTCPAFAKHNTCKHLLAVQAEAEENAAYDAAAEAAEDYRLCLAGEFACTF